MLKRLKIYGCQSCGSKVCSKCRVYDPADRFTAICRWVYYPYTATLTTTTTTPLRVRHVLIFYDLVSVVIVPCGLRILYRGFFMYDNSCTKSNCSIVSPASPFDVFLKGFTLSVRQFYSRNIVYRLISLFPNNDILFIFIFS